jgi:hypothetical protein
MLIFRSANNQNVSKNFRSRRWGSSPPVRARLTCPLVPQSAQRKFSGARVCRVSFKHIPQPLISPKFGNLRTTFQITPLSAQICHSTGVPKFLLWLESSYVCYLGAHAKIQNPTTIPSGRMSNEQERKRERAE